MDSTQKENLVVLSTAYWPNLHYFYYLLHAPSFVIDGYEHYEKQSYRNRCRILSANGVLDLSIPVVHPGKACLAKDVLLSSGSWKAQHFTAIKSAYGKSPYFAYFGDEVKALYEKEYSTLLDFNTAQLQFLLKVLRIKKQIQFTEAYIAQTVDLDLRSIIHPKKDYARDVRVSVLLKTPYYQGFSERFGFSENLSMLDLLFNKGLDSLNYLEAKL